jgi:undecaprenyl-diphosphatase
MKKLSYSMPIISFLLFFILALSTLYGGSAEIEYTTYVGIEKMQGNVGNYFFESITHLFDTKIFLILSIILLILLWGSKRMKDLWLSVIVLAGGSAIGEVLKMAFIKERPVGYLISESGYSFPSGHALKATLFLVLLIYLYKNEIKNIAWRRFFIIVCWALIVLVSFSRLYLGVHWIGDVFGGFFLGLGWVSLVIIMFGKEK